MPAYITFELVIHAEPSEAFAQVKAAVSNASAIITQASRFSNKALSMHIEVNAAQLATLRDELSLLGKLGSGADEKLAELMRTLEGDSEVIALLHVTLVHDAPDQKVEVPKVPG